MDEDDEPATELYNAGAHQGLGNEDGPTSFDASADLKAVIAHAQAAADPETPPTMVLTADQMPSLDPPSAPVPAAQIYQAPPVTQPYRGWGPGGAPPGQGAPAPQAVRPPNSFAKRLTLSALVVFVLGGVAVGIVTLIVTLS